MRGQMKFKQYINEMDTETPLMVKSVKLKDYRGKYNSFIKIEFTPITVYDHVKSYEYFFKEVKKILSPFKLPVDWETERTTGFRDKGLIVNFPITYSTKGMTSIYNALKQVEGKKFEGKINSEIIKDTKVTFKHGKDTLIGIATGKVNYGRYQIKAIDGKIYNINLKDIIQHK